MTFGMRWRGVACPSCGCTGTGPPEAPSCDCGACIPPDDITVSSVTVYRATGSNIACNLVNNAVSIGSNLTLSKNTAIENPPCLAPPSGVDGCWYGPASDTSNDLTEWGGKAGSGCNLNSGCDLVQPLPDANYFGEYFYGAEVWAKPSVQPLLPLVGTNNGRVIDIRVYPKQRSVWNGTTGVPTDFADNCIRPYLAITAHMDPAVKDNNDPYTLCSDTSTYKVSYATSHCSPHDANAFFGTTPAQPLCECWSNISDGGGCQFQGTNPFSNYSRAGLGMTTLTQNGVSYWDETDSLQCIKVPVTDGTISSVDIIKPIFTGDSQGSGRMFYRDGIPDVLYTLDTCTGSITATANLDPNDVMTFTASNGSDC